MGNCLNEKGLHPRQRHIGASSETVPILRRQLVFNGFGNTICYQTLEQTRVDSVSDLIRLQGSKFLC